MKIFEIAAAIWLALEILRLAVCLVIEIRAARKDGEADVR